MTPRDQPTHPPSEDLFAYRDGELPAERRALVEAHVMSCSMCRSLIDHVSSLEAELRQSPDRAPAEYLESLHETVRARIATAGAAGGAELGGGSGSRVEGGRGARGAGAWSGRERRGDGEDASVEDVRVKEAPRLPWAAVISTASAAAAVLVVVVILLKQGVNQHPVLPESRSTISQAPPEEPKADRDLGAGSVTRRKSAEQEKQTLSAKEAKKLEADSKDRLAKSAGGADLNVVGEVSANKAGPATEGESNKPQGVASPSEGEVSRKQEAATEQVAPERADEAPRARAAPQVMSYESVAGGPYDALVHRLGIPPVWDGALVTPEALERAEPELRSLYTSGDAGADSARIRLYLAEAARVRYTPGDSALYEEIQHHYKRAIALAKINADAETARVAAERLQTLER